MSSQRSQKQKKEKGKERIYKEELKNNLHNKILSIY